MSNNPLALAKFELRRFKGPLPVVALIFVLLIPLLYGAIYLVGNWDPYGHLNQLPVAVVNQDQEVDNSGQPMHAGADFVANLHRSNTFDFQDTTAEEAAEGLRKGRYYLIIQVPQNFSADLISGKSDNPTRAQINLLRNDANGFVIGSITQSAQNSIARAIDQTAVKAYFEAVFENLATIKSGMNQAADGASALDKGLASAKSGSTKLAEGANKAKDASGRLSDGAGQLAAGLGTAQDGSSRLSNGIDQLYGGSQQLASGASQVADGTQKLADAVDPVLTTAADKFPAIEQKLRNATAAAAELTKNQDATTAAITELVNGVDTDLTALLAAHPELASDPTIAALKARAEKARGNTSTIATDVAAVSSQIQAANELLQNTPSLVASANDARSKVDQLNSGAHQVATGAATLRDNLATADTGAQQLATGIATAAEGSTKLADGSSQLHEGLVTLTDGMSTLDKGLSDAQTGAHELATKLSDGAQRLPDLVGEDKDRVAEVMSSPADVTMNVDNPAHLYGRGLAPMFFSIALWVLGISAFMLMRPVTGRVLAGRASNLRIALTAWLPMGIVSVVASWLMLAAAWLGLGLNPVHPWLMIALVTLVAVAFSSFAHFLRTGFGLVATAGLLVFLIIQLTAAGGTYPPAILPGFFKALSPFVPMTYSIDAFRICISGGLMEKLLRDVAVLVGLTLASGTALWWVIGRKRRATLVDLHPLIGH
ncbi:MAG: YhgE/Pip family protein [Propionibacteriaceae bacterium]